MNKTHLIGRLTKDPELRHTGSGKAVATFTIAVNRYNPNKDDDADFIRCVAWDKRGEAIANGFRKGNQIGITGNIRTGSYDGNNGQRVYTTDVWVEDFDFLDPKETRQAASTAQNGTNYPDPMQYAARDEPLEISDDDLPF